MTLSTGITDELQQRCMRTASWLTCSFCNRRHTHTQLSLAVSGYLHVAFDLRDGGRLPKGEVGRDWASMN